VFVDQAARDLLTTKLEGSRFADEECLNIMVDFFEKNVSLRSTGMHAEIGLARQSEYSTEPKNRVSFNLGVAATLID
jgi:hypothetical protein